MSSIHLVDGADVQAFEGGNIDGGEVGGDIDDFEVGGGLLHLGEPGQELRLGDGDAGAAIGQHMGEEAALVGGIDGDLHGADAAQADPGPEIFEAVVQHDDDMLAEADAGVGEAVADAVGGVMGLPVGERSAIFVLYEGRIAASISSP